MGKTTWDKVSGLDVAISHSKPRLKGAHHIIVLHRDLKVTPATARVLALALSDDALFRTVVPPFLRHWSGAGDKIHFQEIADAIEAGHMSGNRTWRFGVTPIPKLAAPKSTIHYFEMRHGIVLDEIFHDADVRKKVADGLAQSAGAPNRAFASALRKLLGVLRTTNGRVAYPESAGLFKAVFSATR